MIKRFSKYRKHIKHKNGELYYRNILIRVEMPPEYEYYDISTVKVNFKEKEAYARKTIKTKKRKTQQFFSWLVYFEGRPIYYSSSAFSLENVFDEIDRYYAK
nr:MAG TPA: hypothetical protein [Caudoviricetes sp.]